MPTNTTCTFQSWMRRITFISPYHAPFTLRTTVLLRALRHGRQPLDLTNAMQFTSVSWVKMNKCKNGIVQNNG